MADKTLTAPPPRTAPPPPIKRGIPERPGKQPDLSSIDPARLATDADMAAFADSINQDKAEPASTPPESPTLDVPVIDPVGKVDATPKPEPKVEAKLEPKPEPKTEPKPPADKGVEKPAEKAVLPDHNEELEKLANDSRAPKMLREAYKASRSRIAQLTQELESARQELEKTRLAPDSAKSLTEQLESIRKRADAAESQLAFADYAQSEEFQNSYKRPYEAAVSEAFTELKGLTTADGQPIAESQIQALLMAGEREAYKLIDKLFDPADARFANRLVADVYSKNREMGRVLDTQRKRADELRKEQSNKRAEAQARFKSTFETATEKLAARDPETFDLKTTDSERAQLIADGYKYADAVFDPPKNLNVDQLAVLKADARHKIGIHADLKHRLGKAQTRIKELEDELNRFRSSAPGKGEAPTSDDGRAPEEGTMEGAFNTLDKIVRGG